MLSPSPISRVEAAPPASGVPMERVKILVVDDEDEILELLEYNLSKEGYEPVLAHNGEEALALMRSEAPALVLLDLMLPDLDGLEVCRRMKEEPTLQKIPVVMLTARGEDHEIVAGLEVGADDYIPKPFSPKVLLARCMAVLRRYGSVEASDNLLVIDELTIDAARHQVQLGGELVELTATEFRILEVLAHNRMLVFTRNQIIEAVKGENYPVTERSVDVHIVALRKKLGSMGERIETVRGVGYRFRDQGL